MPSSPDLAKPLFELLARRRMVRSYTSEPVEPALIDHVVTSAFRAPSAGNTRSLELLLLTDDDIARYWETTLSAETRHSFPWPGLLRAPVLLIPYVKPSAYTDRYSESDKARTGLGDSLDEWSVPYWWVDGGAAVENILLTAVAYELGACLFGQFEHEQAVREAFDVPDTFRAVGTVALGHPEPASDRPSRSSQRPKRSIEETTHRGRW